MLRLTRLRMKNFKSFRQATIPFSDGFTVIAGANGSGKSNIMDAVLFALGETSLKSLRASRLTDLVHGGAGKEDKYAVVNLTLQESGRTFEISRTIDKHGKSVYRLNDKRVTLNEIQNLMGELGIRVDGHNLVSQGDLLRIIDMNALERRQLIDEISGLQEFEEKKNEALKDLEKVDRKIKDITIVLNERMAVVEQLARERNVAQKYKKIDEELRRTKATILHLESKDLNGKLEKLVSQQVELIEKKEEASAKNQDSRKSIQELEKEFSELDSKVLGERSKTFPQNERSVEMVRSDLRLAEERISQHQKRREEILNQKKEWQLDLNEWQRLHEQYPEIENQKKKIHEELHRIDEKLAEHSGKAYAHHEAHAHLQKAKSTCPVCNRELTTKAKSKLVEEHQAAHSHAQKQTNHIRGERDALMKQLEELHSNIVLLSRLSKSDERVRQLHEAERELNNGLREVSHQKEKLEKEMVGAEKKQKQFMKINEELLQKRDKVQQKLSIERERERAWQEKMFRVEGQLSEIKVEQSKFDTRLLDVKEELRNYEGVPALEKHTIHDIIELRKTIPTLEHEIRQLGTVNLKSLEDFGQYEKDVLEIRQKVDTLEEERLAVLDLITSIDLKRNETFYQTFNAINENFNKLYTSFFNGTAKLSLTNPAKPLESGLLIEAKHSDEKMLKSIDLMSGGEKSLTSLAFIFAIQLYEPAPFYFFDEVDAALDMTNSRKVGLLIQEMSKSSQFISITHNDSVVKVADQIVGVAKTNTNSSVIGLKTNGDSGHSPTTATG